MFGKLTGPRFLVAAAAATALCTVILAQQAQVDVSGAWRDGHYILKQNGDVITSDGDFGHANGHFTGPYTFTMSWASATWTATVSQDGNRIDWNNNSTWYRSGSSGSGGTKTQRTGVITVRHTNGNCNHNDCSPNGCASCQTLTVYLPLNAQVAAIRCYTNAGGPAGDAPSPQQNPCGDLDAWATFDSPRQYTTPTNTVVETVFHNRSNNRDRLVELQIDWR